MKNKIITLFKIFVPLLLIIITVTFTVKGVNINIDNSRDLKEKVSQEILFFENKLISISNKVNNISFSNYAITESKIDDSKISKSKEEGESSNKEESKEQSSNNNTNQKVQYELKEDTILTNKNDLVDWDYIKLNVELLYSNWTKTVLDLYSLNIDKKNILSFGNELDNLIISVKNENKVDTLKNISALFSYLPKYEEEFSYDKRHINIQYSKYYILNSYCLLEENRWIEINESIILAKSNLESIITDVNNNIRKDQSRINNIYISLNELENSISFKDKDIFYIKYKNLMSDLSGM